METGDAVRCVETRNSSLVVGNLYETLSMDSTFITVLSEDGCEYKYFRRRFEQVNSYIKANGKRVVKLS